MNGLATIFLDTNLPNAVTWFYFSGLLAVALFFKFSRVLSLRNWDVLTLFLLMPGLLLLIDGNAKVWTAHTASQGNPDIARLLNEGSTIKWWGYVWLLAISGYFLVRCLLDLTLTRRPSLPANLSLGGLAWLAGALFVSLVAVAGRQQEALPGNGVAKPSQLDDPVKERVKRLVVRQTGANESDVGVWVERGLALVCHLSIVVGLVLIGWRIFDDLAIGMTMATFYLLLPYTFVMLPGTGLGRWDHAWPMAWMIWAVLAYRWPLLAGLFIGVAAGTVFVPAFTVPVWLSFYWRRGAGRFLLTFVLAAGLSLAVVGGLIALAGASPASLRSVWSLSNWQPWLPPPTSLESIWNNPSGFHLAGAYRLPVFLVYTAFVITTLFWPSPKDLAQVVALTAAVLISPQFWYADQGGIYVLWYLPLVLLLMFRPNLTLCQPPPPGEDWLERLGRFLSRSLRRLLRLPEPATPVA
jgi:hypothetical protein